MRYALQNLINRLKMKTQAEQLAKIDELSQNKDNVKTIHIDKKPKYEYAQLEFVFTDEGIKPKNSQ